MVMPEHPQSISFSSLISKENVTGALPITTGLEQNVQREGKGAHTTQHLNRSLGRCKWCHLSALPVNMALPEEGTVVTCEYPYPFPFGVAFEVYVQW